MSKWKIVTARTEIQNVFTVNSVSYNNFPDQHLNIISIQRFHVWILLVYTNFSKAEIYNPTLNSLHIFRIWLGTQAFGMCSSREEWLYFSSAKIYAWDCSFSKKWNNSTYSILPLSGTLRGPLKSVPLSGSPS